MFKRIEWCWRVFGVALSFLAIGIGGLFIFPLLHIVIWQHQRRQRVARDLIRLTFRAIVRSMCTFGVFRYDANGLARLNRQGLLILANHPTLIDIVFLMAFVPRADCIVKEKLWRNPFTRATVRAAGYICNRDNSVRLVEDCVASVRDGGNLIIFPEGTRTPPDGAISLKRGAANIAVRTPCKITPVLIRCAPPMLVKGEPWWRLPAQTSKFRFDVKEDIDIGPFVDGAANEVLAARRMTAHLRQIFVNESDCGAGN
ncbi:MAG TPA: lysophospholipid acyltransferase family protein [Candidatus Limnocylindrales bacterium]|nr:lysophospholipid acyltransferase family protein [Candidatus Limnocylindrales bacterium]